MNSRIPEALWPSIFRSEVVETIDRILPAGSSHRIKLRVTSIGDPEQKLKSFWQGDSESLLKISKRLIRRRLPEHKPPSIVDVQLSQISHDVITALVLQLELPI